MVLAALAEPSRSQRRWRGHLLRGLALATALLATPAAAQSQSRFVLKGLQDLEMWETDSGSRLLARDAGDPAPAGRLRLWLAADFNAGFQGVVVGRAEGGKGTASGKNDMSLEQAFLRWVSGGAGSVSIDAGRVVMPFGNFSRRYLSTVNPLVGAPDSYDVSYPTGLSVSARVSRFDARVAVLDRPYANAKYVPPSSRAFRPGIELGVTPTVGLRFGAYYTKGPYLGDSISWALPAGERWRDFDQEIVGVDLSFSRGYFELNGDYAYSRYDVPTQAGDSHGRVWYLEPKYTWTPRFYTAIRLEHNDYPYIQPIDNTFWLGSNAAFYDVEVGFGWRFNRDLVLKASYRRDHWNVDPSLAPYLPNGHAVALQLSYAFDVISWFERPR